MIPIHQLIWTDWNGTVSERIVPDREAELLYDIKCKDNRRVEWHRSDKPRHTVYEYKGVEMTVWND